MISSLLFVALLYHVRQGALLQQKTEANEQLALTTRKLEEERVRLDALLVRQYEVLACLDNKDAKGSGLTMEHIGEVRRLVAEAANRQGSSGALDQIEMHEILGEGAFGKVHKVKIKEALMQL